MFDRKFLLIVILLFITILISWGFYFYDYKVQDTIDIKEFPSTIDTWVSHDLPIDKADLAVLETNNAFLRCYTDEFRKYVYLYIYKDEWQV